jgi:hypothetical protein
MADDGVDGLIAEITALSQEEALRLYMKLSIELPEKAEIAALGVRDKARAGQIDAAMIPLLAQCLADAPNDVCVVHLAKALAAFGRKAQIASGALVEKTAEIRVTDDASYWMLDSAVWALAYLGGPEALAFVDKMKREKPSRALKSRSVYQGDMNDADREKRFQETLDGARALISGPDPGTWREKKTSLKPKKGKGSKAPKKPWMR